VKEGTGKFPIAGIESVFLAELDQFCVIPDVDYPEGIVFGPNAKGYFSLSSLEIFDI